MVFSSAFFQYAVTSNVSQSSFMMVKSTSTSLKFDNSSLNNFWLKSICAKKHSAVRHRDNLSHFNQAWEFTQPVLDWLLFNVINSMLFHY